MVSSKEAKTLSYQEYKRVFWTRLRDYWLEYREHHPARADQCNAELARCREQLRIWGTATAAAESA